MMNLSTLGVLVLMATQSSGTAQTPVEAAAATGLWRSASSSEGFRTHGWNDRPFSKLRRLQRGSDSALCCEPRGELRI